MKVETNPSENLALLTLTGALLLSSAGCANHHLAEADTKLPSLTTSSIQVNHIRRSKSSDQSASYVLDHTVSEPDGSMYGVEYLVELNLQDPEQRNIARTFDRKINRVKTHLSYNNDANANYPGADLMPSLPATVVFNFRDGKLDPATAEKYFTVKQIKLSDSWR